MHRIKKTNTYTQKTKESDTDTYREIEIEIRKSLLKHSDAYRYTEDVKYKQK